MWKARGLRAGPGLPLSSTESLCGGFFYTSHILLCKWSHTLNQPVKESITQWARKKINSCGWPTGLEELTELVVGFWEMSRMARRGETPRRADMPDFSHLNSWIPIYWNWLQSRNKENMMGNPISCFWVVSLNPRDLKGDQMLEKTDFKLSWMCKKVAFPPLRWKVKIDNCIFQPQQISQISVLPSAAQLSWK